MSRLINSVIFLLIFLALISAGFVSEIVDLGHFRSSISLFEFAFNNNFRFGIDLIDNVGPYGYLHYPSVYSGGSYWIKMCWFFVVCFFYSYYVLYFIGRIRIQSHKYVLVFLIIILQPEFNFILFETIPRLAILFSAVYFLDRQNNKINWLINLHIVANSLFYAFLTLEKASNVYFIIFILIVLSVYWAQRNQWRYSLTLIGVYLFGLFLFWISAGQNRVAGLLDYFSSMRVFIDAYQETLAVDINNRDFIFAIFYSFYAAVLIFTRLCLSLDLRRKIISVEIYRSVLLMAFLFLTWKLGIIRGLNSYSILLYTLPIMFGYLCFYPIKIASKNIFIKFSLSQHYSQKKITNLIVASFAPIIMLLLINMYLFGKEQNHSVNFIKIYFSRINDLVNFSPNKKLEELEASLWKLRKQNLLPLSIKGRLELGSVDEFGSSPEIIILNQLNYLPRPIPINFIVSNTTLNRRNGIFYGDVKTAPDYIFLDGGYGFRVADTLAYLSLIFNYEAIAPFNNWLILEKRKRDWLKIEFQNELVFNSNFNDWIPLNQMQDKFLWMEAEAKRSFLGELKSLLYKPDFVRIDIMLQSGAIIGYPISLAQLKAGLLINPIFSSEKTALLLMDGKLNPKWDVVKAFRIIIEDTSKYKYFSNKIKLNFSSLTGSKAPGGSLIPIEIVNADSLISLTGANYPKILTTLPVDLLSGAPRDDIIVNGLSGLERNNNEVWRWAIGPQTKINFFVDNQIKLNLKFAFKNGVPIPNQAVTVKFNGDDIRYFSASKIAMHEIISEDLTLKTKKGVNTIEFKYDDWNHGKVVSGKDPRQLSIVFMDLSLKANH